MKGSEQPDRIHLGAGLVMISVRGLGESFGVTEEAAEQMLGFFKIPLMKVPGGEKRYFSLYPLEMALFELGMPEALRGDRVWVTASHELAGVLYGTLRREVIRERVKALAKTLRKGAAGLGRKKK